jgi:tellurite resistance protein TehA-like permease
MPWVTPPDFWDLLIALSISTVSGAVSISRRVLRGYPCSILWVISEFLMAMLCGYLMYNAYPTIQHIFPVWMTPTMSVAVAAHFGGRGFQELERVFIKQINRLTDQPKQ